jgi:hypothetical protein
MWDHIKTLFENKKSSGRRGLFKRLLSLKIDTCPDMAEFIKEVRTIKTRLAAIEFNLPDDI